MGDAFHTIRDAEPERAVVMAVWPSGFDGEAELDEMDELLRTAAVAGVGRIVQRRLNPHPRTYLGPGKLQELQALAHQVDAEVVVCDDELTPVQQRVLEDTLEMRVVDRTAVILDIFAAHAHTAEGKLQVELAQLEYSLPRMRGLWKHLERLGGGVGTRGPGESQLETDRRLARTRIQLLKKRIALASQHRRTARKRRESSETPSVSLAGYTNVGKSTLLNALTGAEVSSADRLFETLDPTTRAYVFGGRAYTLTDTVGFIRKLPHGLVEAFASTLEETIAGDLIIHVADASAPEEERLAQQARRRGGAGRDRRGGDRAAAGAEQGRPARPGGAPAAAERQPRRRPDGGPHGRGAGGAGGQDRRRSSPTGSSRSSCWCRTARARSWPRCTRSARRSSARTPPRAW